MSHIARNDETDAARSGLRIRPAIPTDGQAVLDMVRALIVALEDDTKTLDPQRFLEDAFGPNPPFELRVAELEGVLVGYALFHDGYEPCHAARGTYVCDLYVQPQVRRQGVARALMAAVAQRSQERGGVFLWWVSRQGGDEARSFYRTLTPIAEAVVAHALVGEDFQQLVASRAQDK